MSILQVYFASTTDGPSSTLPVIVARDRLDLTLWLDDSTQSRFVMAGDLLRAWIMWDLIPEQVLLHVQSADVTRAPRPLGVSTHLKDTPRNWDPTVGASRERIYLEHSTEPGNCGQCCLLFKVPAASAGQAALQATEKPSVHSHLQCVAQEKQGQSCGTTMSTEITSKLRAQQSRQLAVLRDGAAMSPIFPATPRQTATAMSTERRGPDETITKPGHVVPQSSISSHSDGDDSSQPRTPPVTADAISSLWR